MPSSPLSDFLREAIRRSGPVTFAWFMEQALYHPAHGYYSSGRAALGRGGDYSTSVSVGPIFGRLLAMQFAEMWERMGRPDDFAIVEQGAHGGEFAHDVLTAARDGHADFFAALRYAMVEPFATLRERQAATLTEFADKISWHSSLNELPPFRGVHFSNELLDAFPVHLGRWTGEEWLERYVTHDDKDFFFVDQSLSDPRLVERLRHLPQPLPPGYETEINLAALDWMEALAGKITAGFVLVADYGWPRDEYYAPHRSSGTLRCYAQHRVVSSPFIAVGETDITAHVDWTSLTESAQSRGCALAGFTDQHHFITGLLARDDGGKFVASADAKTKRALQTLLHPQHLGMKFQFLCLARAMDVDTHLSGFRFARDAKAELGLS